MKEASKPGAIIIGGHYLGLGAIKSLAEKGVPVCLVDSELNVGRFSKYARRFYKCPGVKDETSFLNFLKNLALKEKLKGWVVFPTDDETVYFLSRHREELDPYYRITTAPWDITKYAYDKRLTYQLAMDLGIPIPKTYFPKDFEEISQYDLSFPFILKPAIVKKFYEVTKRKVYVVNSKQALKELYRKACLIITPSEVMVQEFIPGETEHPYSFCPMFKEGKVVARVIARRARQHPMDFGHASSFVETVNIPELEQIGTTLLKAMHYYGIAEVEYKQDPRDGRFKLLEINPRIWGWHTISRKAGISLTYVLFQDLIGHEVSVDGFREGVKWIRLTTDIPTVFREIIKRNLKWSDYIHSIRGEKEFDLFSIQDPLPMIVEMLLLPYFWLKKTELNLNNSPSNPAVVSYVGSVSGKIPNSLTLPGLLSIIYSPGNRIILKNSNLSAPTSPDSIPRPAT